MKAVLHGGPGEGSIDENVADPPPKTYRFADPLPLVKEQLEPARANQPTPELRFAMYSYRLERVEDDAAHYDYLGPATDI